MAAKPAAPAPSISLEIAPARHFQKRLKRKWPAIAIAAGHSVQASCEKLSLHGTIGAHIGPHIGASTRPHVGPFGGMEAAPVAAKIWPVMVAIRPEVLAILTEISTIIPARPLVASFVKTISLAVIAVFLAPVAIMPKILAMLPVTLAEFFVIPFMIPKILALRKKLAIKGTFKTGVLILIQNDPGRLDGPRFHGRLSAPRLAESVARTSHGKAQGSGKDSKSESAFHFFIPLD